MDTVTNNTAESSVTELEDRAIAFAILGQLLGEDTTTLVDGRLEEALGEVLGRLGEHRAREVLGDSQRIADLDLTAEDLNRRWIRWFEHARIAPYEGSNVAVTAGGVTARLADVAGFYRAFGVKVRSERPDHVVAELEFMSLVLLQEAEATRDGDTEAAEICAKAARSFLRDHLGGWLDAWAIRVSGEPALTAWAPLANCAAVLVASEAKRRNVVPLRTDAILTSDAGIAEDELFDLECGADEIVPD